MGVLETLVSQAVASDLDTLEVRYKDGYQEVFGIRGNIGFGIARFPSTSQEATSLRRELRRIAKKRHRVVLTGGGFEMGVRVFDSFGEDAFRVELRRAKARQRRAG
jgi:hypothetical protein